MKDKHNVILILVSSKWFNSLFRSGSSYIFLVSSAHLSFPEFQALIITEIHLNHYKVSPCVFNFSFFSLSFVYRSSSWRFYMMVHQGFISFSKCSSRFFSKEFKHYSSCNPECHSFYRIIRGGIMSFLMIWVHVPWFTCC